MTQTPITLGCTNITSTERWMTTLTVMLVTIIEILDMTIVNVAVPQMMGELGANSDQITWVLTSYIVSSAIVMPLTGFLVNRFGRKNLLLTNIIGFLITSMLCGLSNSLAQIVFFRTLQGIFGASLVPLSQYILNDIFPREEQGKAMAIWGIGIMIAPVLGPTLGGYITESLNWRWVFYINLPVCLITFFLAIQFVRGTPAIKEKIDWIGLFLMAVGIACLQIFLDRGNTSDWFNSKVIVILFIAWIFLLSAFVIRNHYREGKDVIVNLKLFRNRNFAAATFMLTIFGIAMFGIVAIQPLMLEHLMGYNAQTAGLLMAPRGIAAALGMSFSAILIKRYDMRYIMAIGILIAAYSTYLMSQFNLDSSFYVMSIPTAIQGFGSGFFFVPLSTMALTSLSEKDTAEGSGLFNFGRNLGGSIGISLLSTLITRESQINWNRLTRYVQETDFKFQHWAQLQHMSTQATPIVQKAMEEVAKQSSMIAFIDAYWVITIAFMALLPFVFLMTKVNLKNKSTMLH